MGFFNKVWRGLKSAGRAISTGVDWVLDRGRDVGVVLNKGLDYAKQGWDAVKKIPVIGEIAEQAIPRLVESIPVVGPYIKDVPKFVDTYNKGLDLAKDLNKNIRKGNLTGIGENVQDISRIVRTMPFNPREAF